MKMSYRILLEGKLNDAIACNASLLSILWEEAPVVDSVHLFCDYLPMNIQMFTGLN